MDKTELIEREKVEETEKALQDAEFAEIVPHMEKSAQKTTQGVIYHTLKRVFDIFAGLFGMLLLAPLAAVVKIISLIHKDKSPIFFKQKRIGYKGQEFTMYKFRTMVVGADDILDELLENDGELRAEYDENKKLKKDPRVTKVGKFLRRSSLDEFPQMICIFTGKMTLVGNRPYLPKERADMGEYFDDIVKTKPGLTGYWQVNGRSETSFQKRLELEQYYSNHASLLFDLKIIFHTFKAVFGGSGAC